MASVFLLKLAIVITAPRYSQLGDAGQWSFCLCMAEAVSLAPVTGIVVVAQPFVDTLHI